MSSPSRLLDVLRRNPAFRRLFLANAVSQIGDWLNVVALMSLLIELTGKGETVALAFLSHFVPLFLLGSAGGVLADRYSRRTILVVTDLARAVLVVGLLFVRDPSLVWVAYVLMIGRASASAFFEPAQQATYPNLVSRDDLVLASALENSLWAITLAVGSALGGLLLGVVGRDVVFVLDALSFLVSAWLLRGLPDSAARAKTSVDKAAISEAHEPEPASWVNLLGLSELREGLRYVATNARVRALLLAKASFGLTLGGVLVLLTFFGETVFGHGGGTGMAALWTARGIGSFLGPFVAFRIVGETQPGLRRGIAIAFALISTCYVAFSVAPSLRWAVVALAIANAGGSILWTYASALVQMVVPDEVRGRVAAADLCAMTLTLSVSTLVTGWLFDAGVSARTLMAACGAVALIPLVLWTASQGLFRPTVPDASG